MAVIICSLGDAPPRVNRTHTTPIEKISSDNAGAMNAVAACGQVSKSQNDDCLNSGKWSRVGNLERKMSITGQQAVGYL
jgi:hypothetical protein